MRKNKCNLEENVKETIGLSLQKMFFDRLGNKTVPRKVSHD